MKTSIVIIFIFLLVGCTPESVLEREPFIYGPRWMDVDEWSQLKFGMSIDNVWSILGEPYLPERSVIQNGKTVDIIYWKMKPKYYVVQERSRVSSTIGILKNQKRTSQWIEQEKKPDKKAITNVWGEYFTLACVFDDGKLVEWYCPELPELIQLEKGSHSADSLLKDTD
jgi:hypothetical protein